MITIDGRTGEGGGQMLRTSLALSLLTGKPFQMSNVRGRRKKPGLLRQHLTALEAAAAVGGAAVTGDHIGSGEVSFAPTRLTGGSYTFAVGSAGSAMLVLQTVLPALLRADGPSDLVLEGGTHNPAAPPFDFLDRAFLPLLRRMGVEISAELERPGFYPAGGGRARVHIEPCPRLGRLELVARGKLVKATATAVISGLPGEVAERELATLGARLGWPREALMQRSIRTARGPGNVLVAVLEHEHVTEVFAGFGERGKPAEKVASEVADEVEAYLSAGVPVGQHMADQLLLPMAMGEGGVFVTLAPTPHTTTQIATIRAFLERDVGVRPLEGGAWEMRVGAA
jgi:RNA 3'-terminal phosphate cyclase (ATP)